MSLILYLLTSVATLAASALAFPLNAPEKGSLTAVGKDGKQRWQAEWSMQPQNRKGASVVRLTEEGRGIYSPFETPVHWKMESWWLAGPPLRPGRVERQVYDPQGEVLLSWKTEFDWAAGLARFERRSSNGEMLSKVIEVPPDTWTPDGLAVALRQMDFKEGATISAHLLTDEPKLYSVRFRIESREKVPTGQGDIDCYKVGMDVDLGLLSLFKFAIPDTRLWFAAESPHMWVRYQGLEDGRRSPQIVRKMTSFSRLSDRK